MENDVESASDADLGIFLRRALTETIHRARRRIQHEEAAPTGRPDADDDTVLRARNRLTHLVAARESLDAAEDSNG